MSTFQNILKTTYCETNVLDTVPLYFSPEMLCILQKSTFSFTPNYFKNDYEKQQFFHRLKERLKLTLIITNTITTTAPAATANTTNNTAKKGTPKT